MKPWPLRSASEIELAIAYAKPVVIFSNTLEQVDRFHPAVERLHAIDDIDEFLRRHVPSIIARRSR